MKYFKVLCVIALAICASFPQNAYAKVEEIYVNGVVFRMVHVEGGTFMMGGTAEQGEALDDEEPVHQVTLTSFNIGETEVTQELWEAVMGENPSVHKGPKHPVESVSWNDCIKFISKLNYLTNRHFRLPTEAEWEFAARGGLKSCRYKYSGGNNLEDIAWYDYDENQRTDHQEVGLKRPNELGLYDMSGNVSEWCQDFYDGDYYSRSPEFNPCNIIPEGSHTQRGGSIYTKDESLNELRVSARYLDKSDRRCDNSGFRLAEDITDAKQSSTVAPKNRDIEEVQVGDATIKMIRVEGGAFTMGHDDDYDNEAPKHRVTLSDYYIGETEVTRLLWAVVMNDKLATIEEANLPVMGVSWDECKEFIKKLNDYTGKNFRLTTEAEWEFAARGGVKSKGYTYSGSDNINKVAWYDNNSRNKPHKVKSLKPNELGLYDMSGNAWEWCEDVYDFNYYSKSPEKNPCCKYSKDYPNDRVRRGGSWFTFEFTCNPRSRFHDSTDSIDTGLRLAW